MEQGATGADGSMVPAYGVTDGVSGCFIFDPYASSCGRFRVDPLDEYGIEETDANRLVECNRRLGVLMPQSESPVEPMQKASGRKCIHGCTLELATCGCFRFKGST